MNLILPVAVDIGSHGPNFHTATTLDESVAAVDRASRAFVAAGLTTVCDAQVTSRELTAYEEARSRGLLGVRTVCMPLSHQLDALLDLGLTTGFGDDHLRLGAMKFYADGSLIGGTACFHDAYGEDADLEGSMYWEPGQFEDAVRRAHLARWQIGVHVAGRQGDGHGARCDRGSGARRSPRPPAPPRARRIPDTRTDRADRPTRRWSR